MPFDGARLMKRWAAISETFPGGGELRDLRFLSHELVSCLVRAPTGRLAGGKQFATDALDEPIGPDLRERFFGGSELHTGFDAPTLPAQPLAVQELNTGQTESEADTAELVERLAERRFDGLTIAEQRRRKGADATLGRRAAGLGLVCEAAQSRSGDLGPAAAGARLDELAQSPGKRTHARALAGSTGGRESRLVPTKPVVKIARAYAARTIAPPSLSAVASWIPALTTKCAGFLTAPGGEHERPEQHGQVPATAVAASASWQRADAGRPSGRAPTGPSTRAISHVPATPPDRDGAIRGKPSITIISGPESAPGSRDGSRSPGLLSFGQRVTPPSIVFPAMTC